jgi:excisionase family DNA binding protein
MSRADDDRSSVSLLTVAEVAAQLGVSVHTVYSWVAQRRLPFLKVGRLLRFDARTIEAWLHEQCEREVRVEETALSRVNR